MTAEYAAGVVALVTAYGRSKPYRAFFDGNTWREWGSGGFCVTDPTSIHPLVVLDPEDLTAEDIERAVHGWGNGPSARDRAATRLLRFAAQLKAQTCPPKPAEPTGLGAVVEDAQGMRWVRVDYPTARWVDGRSFPQRWRDLDVVRVLSEGVPADAGRD